MASSPWPSCPRRGGSSARPRVERLPLPVSLPLRTFLLAMLQLLLVSGTPLEPEQLVSNINRDVAIRFSHGTADGPSPADRALLHASHLEDVHFADEVVKQTQARVAAILAVRQVAWSKARARLSAGDAGAGDRASFLLNEETTHINEIERNLTDTSSLLVHQKRIANLSHAAFDAQTYAQNASLTATASKAQAERDAESTKAAAGAELAAKEELRAEEEHWRARHNSRGGVPWGPSAV